MHGDPDRMPAGARSSMDRVADFESEGWAFESPRARHVSPAGMDLSGGSWETPNMPGAIGTVEVTWRFVE